MLSESHSNVLRLINQSGPLSRTELVGHLGISKASMSSLAAELIEKGMLTEAETVYGAGRPSVRLALASASAFFLGVSLASDPVILRATDLGGALLDGAELEASRTPEVIVARIAAAVDRMRAGGKVAAEKISGIGLAIPGLVDARAGVCIRSTVLGWRDVAIGPAVAEATGLPTFVENDANALALGQHLFGGLRGSSDSTLVSVGEGIGCGHIVGGELHRGARGGAGEIAHATIVPNGLPCRCGKRGCLDTLASTKAIARAAREAGLPADLAALDAAAADGNGDAVAILHDGGAALGLAIAQLVQIIDPARILVALTDGPIDGLYVRVMRQTLEANVMPTEADRLDVSLLALDRQEWARAAASVAAGRTHFQV